MNYILQIYKNSHVYNSFYKFTSVKYNIPLGTLDNKLFPIVLGFLIDFMYTKGFSILASEKGYKITQHRKGELIIFANGGERSDDYANTNYIKTNVAPTLDNYELCANVLLRGMNAFNEPF